jgi:hypothetical protein
MPKTTGGNAVKALLDARWLAMKLLGIDGDGANPFPSENPGGQEAFRRNCDNCDNPYI